jgi:hypothetical protein
MSEIDVPEKESACLCSRGVHGRVEAVWQGFWTRGGATPHELKKRGCGAAAWLLEQLIEIFDESRLALPYTPTLAEYVEKGSNSDRKGEEKFK